MSVADSWQQFLASVTWRRKTPGSDYQTEDTKALPKIVLLFNQARKWEKINLSLWSFIEKGEVSICWGVVVMKRSKQIENENFLSNGKTDETRENKEETNCFHNANTQNWIFIMMPRFTRSPSIFTQDISSESLQCLGRAIERNRK